MASTSDRLFTADDTWSHLSSTRERAIAEAARLGVDYTDLIRPFRRLIRAAWGSGPIRSFPLAELGRIQELSQVLLLAAFSDELLAAAAEEIREETPDAA